MTMTKDVGRGAYERVADPAVHIPAARRALGHLGFSVYMAQGPLEFLIQTCGTKIVNRLVFRGGWTLLAWRSDVYAPKRERMHKERFATKEEALAAFDRLAVTIRGHGR